MFVGNLNSVYICLSCNSLHALRAAPAFLAVLLLASLTNMKQKTIMSVRVEPAFCLCWWNSVLELCAVCASGSLCCLRWWKSVLVEVCAVCAGGSMCWLC